MSYRVAILGHSQVPLNFPSIAGVETRIYRKSGAKLQRFGDYPEFTEVFSWPHDHNIIFLGGNDIGAGTNAWTAEDIATKLISICWQLHHQGQTVSLVQIEPRQYLSEFYHDFYRRESDKVNRRLKRYIKRRQGLYRLISYNAAPFREGHSIDGVHFSAVSVQCIISKMKHAIMYFREEYNHRHNNN